MNPHSYRLKGRDFVHQGKIEIDVNERAVFIRTQGCFFVYTNSDCFLNSFSDSDIYFESDNHETITTTSSDLEPRALICTHNFKSGYADRHYPQSNGGCIVKTYTAKICTKCNHLVLYDCIGTTNYPKCPHK